MYDFDENRFFIYTCIIVLILFLFFVGIAYTYNSCESLENRIKILEKYHENEHYCPYCNSVIDNVKEI